MYIVLFFQSFIITQGTYLHMSSLLHNSPQNHERDATKTANSTETITPSINTHSVSDSLPISGNEINKNTTADKNSLTSVKLASISPSIEKTGSSSMSIDPTDSAEKENNAAVFDQSGEGNKEETNTNDGNPTPTQNSSPIPNTDAADKLADKKLGEMSASRTSNGVVDKMIRNSSFESTSKDYPATTDPVENKDTPKKTNIPPPSSLVTDTPTDTKTVSSAKQSLDAKDLPLSPPHAKNPQTETGLKLMSKNVPKTPPRSLTTNIGAGISAYPTPRRFPRWSEMHSASKTRTLREPQSEVMYRSLVALLGSRKINATNEVCEYITDLAEDCMFE